MVLPHRVVAGPGSGKTRVLTARAAHLMLAGGAQPWQLMCITFTNKVPNCYTVQHTPQRMSCQNALGLLLSTQGYKGLAP